MTTKLQERADLSPIIERVEDWAITEYGLEHRFHYYPIEAEDLWEGDWLHHMSGKQWVDINTFSPALIKARVYFYGLIDFVNSVSKEDYIDYLKSDRWSALRQIVLTRCGHQCQVCMNRKLLNVHHRTYERTGHELLTDLTVLCKICHTKIHKKG